MNTSTHKLGITIFIAVFAIIGLIYINVLKTDIRLRATVEYAKCKSNLETKSQLNEGIYHILNLSCDAIVNFE